MLMSIFLLETFCTLFSCTTNLGDPKPVVAVPVESAQGGIRTDRKLFDHHHTTQVENNGPVVVTASGAVRGQLMRTIGGRQVSAFTSIPFAEPPLGPLRFRAPVPIRPWTGVRDALKLLPYCVQLDGGNTYKLTGTEDCLYMNIFTPMTNFPVDSSKTELLPVMVYIHGGAFVFGNGNYGPSYLLNKDVILVTFNYRVGPLGFLSTGDEAAPGNFGLKDQALALELVAENIGLFGGNKSRVTLMGQSAGGVSVHLHMMSPRTQGLFHQAIAHSASAFVFWAIRDVSPSLTTQLARNFHCPLNDSTLLVDCLRYKDPAFLVSDQFNLFHWWVFPGVLFGPVVEQPSPDAILTELPVDLYRQGKVARIPFISGVVQDEGEIFGFVFSHVTGLRGQLNRKWDSLAPHVFDYVRQINDTSEASRISTAIHDFYLGDQRFTFNTKELVHNAFGDRYMVTGVHKGLQYHSAYGPPTYGYYFNFEGRLGLAKTLGYRQDDWGVSHGDDLLYFMNNSNWFHPLELGSAEYSMSQLLINLWTNFASKGRPTYTTETRGDVDIWSPISDPYNMKFLRLGKETGMIQEPFKERVKFWEDLNVTFYPEPVFGS